MCKYGINFFVKLFILFFGINISNLPCIAQSIGGNAVFNFLTLSPSAKTTALGGVNISYFDADLGMASYQPAFLNSSMGGQIQLSIKPYLASINQYNFGIATSLPNSNTTIAWGVQFMDYGTIAMTDNAGNELGSFKPNEYVLQMSAATMYKHYFQIGASIKLVQSTMGIFKSSGIATDVGIIFKPYNKLTQWAILVNNVGIQLKKFYQKENLPFNITAGVSKKLANAPFEFTLTAQRLSVWDNLYYDQAFHDEQGYSKPRQLQNIFNHLVIGSSLQIGQAVGINMGYNFLKRYDLNIPNQTNGLNGFSAGCNVLVYNIQLQYANAFLQNNLNHHITLLYQFRKN